LQEFRAATSTYSAEYGRSPGGQFLFTTRSGTNDWHGSLFDYFRNDALDATNWFDNANGGVKQAERQNDFGGALGGPVFKDKTFFFVSYDGLRLSAPQAAVTTEVASLSLRQSAPSALQPFLNAFPVPNGADLGNGLAFFTAGYSSPSSLDSTSVRVDHAFGDRLKVFGRFSSAPSSTMTRYPWGLSQKDQQDLKNKVVTLGQQIFSRLVLRTMCDSTRRGATRSPHLRWMILAALVRLQSQLCRASAGIVSHGCTSGSS